MDGAAAIDRAYTELDVRQRLYGNPRADDEPAVAAAASTVAPPPAEAHERARDALAALLRRVGRGSAGR